MNTSSRKFLRLCLKFLRLCLKFEKMSEKCLKNGFSDIKCLKNVWKMSEFFKTFFQGKKKFSVDSDVWKKSVKCLKMDKMSEKKS